MIPPGRPDTPQVERTLFSDLWRVCASVLIGVFVGYALGWALKIPLPASDLVALVAGPTLATVFIVNYRHSSRGAGIARTIGSLAGWLGFVALYFNEEFSRPIMALRVAESILAIFAGIALGLILTGLVVSELGWRRIQTKGPN